MIGHASQSFFSIQMLVSGLAYLLGLLFFLMALQHLHRIGSQPKGSKRENPYVPLAYTLGGVCLLFLPSVYTMVASTVFGAGNVLSYAQYNPFDIFSAMYIIIQTAGVIWFVRGCVLVTQSSEPGSQHGPKGLVFIIAGIFAMNFESTLAFLSSLMSHIATYTLKSTGSS